VRASACAVLMVCCVLVGYVHQTYCAHCKAQSLKCDTMLCMNCFVLSQVAYVLNASLHTASGGAKQQVGTTIYIYSVLIHATDDRTHSARVVRISASFVRVHRQLLDFTTRVFRRRYCGTHSRCSACTQQWCSMLCNFDFGINVTLGLISFAI
jgi:hypothetical protein